MSRSNGVLRTSAAVAVAAALVSGCADMSQRQRDTGTGAAIGAAAGAVLSSATGGSAGTGAVLGGAVGAVAGNIWSLRQEQRRRAMEQATQGTGVKVTRTADNQLELNVPSDISFDVGSAALEPRLRGVLDSFARTLQDDPAVHIRVIGHTDSTGTEALNDRLSLERAQSVRDYLVDRGVAASRIEIAGRGSREPVASNDTAEGRAKNRRVEILVGEAAG